jgi:transcription antitermination factor NusG
MVVGNIVLMNFIIAVVGQSYSDCMEKQIAQTFRTKVDMIVEREQMMTTSEFNEMREKYFPHYILVRRPMDREAMQAREEESRM